MLHGHPYIPLCSTATLDMTSLAASSQLQNAITYCTKVHKMWVSESNNSITFNLGSPNCIEIHADLVYTHARYNVTSCFQSVIYRSVEKWPKIPPPMALGHFSGAEFCLAQPIGVLLASSNSSNCQYCCMNRDPFKTIATGECLAYHAKKTESRSLPIGKAKWSAAMPIEISGPLNLTSFSRSRLRSQDIVGLPPLRAPTTQKLTELSHYGYYWIRQISQI